MCGYTTLREYVDENSIPANKRFPCKVAGCPWSWEAKTSTEVENAKDLNKTLQINL